MTEPVSYTHLDVYKRQVWFSDCYWDYGTYCNAGICKYCRCNEHDSTNRNSASVYQLWWNINGCYYDRDGNGIIDFQKNSFRIRMRCYGR